jgi:hypothetical protein
MTTASTDDIHPFKYSDNIEKINKKKLDKYDYSRYRKCTAKR